MGKGSKADIRASRPLNRVIIQLHLLRLLKRLVGRISLLRKAMALIRQDHILRLHLPSLPVHLILF